MQQTLCVFVGTYTQPIRFGTGQLLEGKGQGIHAYTMDENSGTLKERFVAKGIDNPSYLAFSADKTHLYAVNELKRFQNQDSGAVSAFRLDKRASGLTFLNQQPTQGTDPCHVTLNAAQTHVYVSNFMSGSVSVFPIAPDGSLQDSCCFLQHHGSSGASAPANRPARTFARLYAGSALCARSRSWPGPADGLCARQRKRQAFPRAHSVFSNRSWFGPAPLRVPPQRQNLLLDQ